MGRAALRSIKRIHDEFLRKRLTFFVLGASFVGHSLAILIVVYAWDGTIIPFRFEYIICLCVSFALELAGFCVRRVVTFRVVHAARFGVMTIAILLLRGESIVIPLLITVPFFAESVIYDANKIGIVANGMFLLILTGVFVDQIRSRGFASAVFVSGSYVVIAGSAAVFAALLVIYRERLVDAVGRIENLNSTVVNLSDANKAFQLYADNIESKTAEKERQRITRELHDTVGYALTNVIVMMNAAKVLVREDPDALNDLFDRIRGQSENALNETRQILYRLRNIHDSELRGLRAIAQLVHSFEGATGIRIELNIGNLPWALGRRLDSALYRLVQEGLTNSFRHGKATKVSINMWRSEEEIRVSIRDNGGGAGQGGHVVAGIGLSGMQERFASLGGTILPHNVSDGFELKATIPYRMGRLVETSKSTDS